MELHRFYYIILYLSTFYYNILLYFYFSFLTVDIFLESKYTIASFLYISLKSFKPNSPKILIIFMLSMGVMIKDSSLYSLTISLALTLSILVFGPPTQPPSQPIPSMKLASRASPFFNLSRISLQAFTPSTLLALRFIKRSGAIRFTAVLTDRLTPPVRA